jgi:hypothetical protein
MSPVPSMVTECPVTECPVARAVVGPVTGPVAECPSSVMIRGSSMV